MQPVLKVAGIANERCQNDQYSLKLFNELILKVSVLKINEAEKWPTPKIIVSKDPERSTKLYYVYFLRLLSDKNLIDKNPSSKISSMGKFFS